MKKMSLLLVLALLLGLTACGRKEPEAESPPAEEAPLRLETLAVEISKGNLGTQQLTAAVQELPEVLRDYFADTGAVEIGEVSVTVGSSTAATAQTLAAGRIDLAFLPAEAFLRYGGGSVPLLADAQVQQPGDGFQMAGETALICAAASPYGGQLSARSTGGSALTWEELANARWGISETGAAYSCFDLWLSANFDARAADLPQAVLYEDDAALLDAALAGEIDALAIRREGWVQAAEGGTEEALPMLAETEALCSQLAAVAPEREELAQEQFAAALEQVLRRIGGERPELMEALGAPRFSAVEDSDLDSARRLLTLDGKAGS